MYFKASCIGLQMRAQSAAHRSLDETLWRVMCRADLQCCAVGSCTGQCEQQCPATKVKSRFLLFQFSCVFNQDARISVFIHLAYKYISSVSYTGYYQAKTCPHTRFYPRHSVCSIERRGLAELL